MCRKKFDRNGRKEWVGEMKEEWRRILSSRLFWLLLAGAMTVNLWILWDFRGQREYVEVSRKLAEEGVEYVTPEGKEEIIEAFAGAEESCPEQIPVRNMVEGAVGLAEQLRASDLAETCIEAMKLEGGAAEYARKVFEALEPVMEENRKNGTARQFFVPCGGRFFDLFTRWLPLALTAECILAAVLLMMKCINEPFDRRMGGVVYASGKGRRINNIKFRAVTTVTAGFAAAVWGLTLGIGETVYCMAGNEEDSIGEKAAVSGRILCIVLFVIFKALCYAALCGELS